MSSNKERYKNGIVKISGKAEYGDGKRDKEKLKYRTDPADHPAQASVLPDDRIEDYEPGEFAIGYKA